MENSVLPRESWEDQVPLANLSLGEPKQQEDEPKETPGPGTDGSSKAEESTTSLAQPGHHADEAPDPALVSALVDPKERSMVLKMEMEVLNFLSDPSQDIFEFGVALSNYQRMLAHKVAQYYALQTTTADHEGNLCRVVAHRTGVQQKNKVLLSSLDVGPGSPLSIVAKSSAPWQETPKILKRVTRDNPSNPAPPRTTTPKDREEAYDRARARILTDGDAGVAAASVPTGGRGVGAGGRGVAFGGGRGRGRGGRDRGTETYDPDYTRGMNRYGGIAGFEGMPMHGMGPTVMMMPHGGSPMYAMHGQQHEMSWGAGAGKYMGGHQPPPPPPASTSSNSYSSKGGAGTGGGAVWSGTGGVLVRAGSGVTPASTPGNQTGASGAATGVPPPPPPPPHGAARPYPIPGSVMTATPFQHGPSAPMAMYPAGSMQHMHGMGTAMYAYPLPSGGVGYAMMPEQAMAHGSPAQMGHYPGGGYMGGMQAMAHAGQGYQAMYGGHMGPMGANMGMPRSPGSPGMAMAYAPMHGMHGYAMPYPMQAMQPHAAGMSTLTSAGSGGLYTGPGMQGQGNHMGGTTYSTTYATNGTGGRGGSRGGYKPYGQHQQTTSAQAYGSQQSTAASGPNSGSSIASKPGAQGQA